MSAQSDCLALAEVCSLLSAILVFFVCFLGQSFVPILLTIKYNLHLRIIIVGSRQQNYEQNMRKCSRLHQLSEILCVGGN